MKPLLVAVLLISLGSARADMVVRQHLESAASKGPIVLKFKGDRGRIDMKSPSGGDVTILMNLATDQVVNLLPVRKLAYVGVLSRQREKTDGAMKRAGIDVALLQPQPTGRRDKIGAWDVEEYFLDVGGVKFHLWVAPNFPNWPRYKGELARFSKANTGGALNPDAMNLPGMVVKSEGDTPMGKMTTTLVSATEEAVPESELTIPEGFNVQEMPATTRVP